MILKDKIKDFFRAGFEGAFSESTALQASAIQVTRATQENFGHYQCNSAMSLSKTLKLNPKDIALKVQAQLIQLSENPKSAFYQWVSKIEIAGPGFMNLTLNPELLSDLCTKLLTDPYFGIPKDITKQRVVIDFSSPNTAKEMHVGHLRSTIIGDCIARLFEFMGHDVLRLNHLGDWGTAFGMLICYLKKYQPAVLSLEEETDLTHLMQWYKASKQLFDTDSAFKKASQLEVIALQSGEKNAINAWKIVCDISSKAYHEIYNYLDVRLIDRGESFYNPYLSDMVNDLMARGFIKINDGAKCLFIDGFTNREGEPLPLMLQKSDGGYNYDTTDLAALKHRVELEHAKRIIYVTDSGQSQHFQMLFKGAEKVGYVDIEQVRLDHVPFGLVLGQDNKKFKTRSGETEKLIDLLQAGVSAAKNIMQARISDNPSVSFSETEINHIAYVLGIGAIKYSDLSINRIHDYVFSYDKMLKFEGNTAAFLIYSYVRVSGLKRKIDVNIDEIIKSTRIQLAHASEIALGFHLCRFPEILLEVSEDLSPNRLCDYLYELANKFNAFFRDCRVQGSPQQNPRLLLAECTARVLKQGLSILGVGTVEKM